MTVLVNQRQLFTIEKRAYMFIDGGYIRKIIKDKLKREDILQVARKYATFIRSLVGEASSFDVRVTRVLYYDANVRVEDDAERHKSRMKFFSDLEKKLPKFDVRLGTLVKLERGYRQKGVDTLLAIDMIVKAFLNHYDVAILVAGDRDFVSVVRAVKEYTGKLVYGVYEQSSIADELERIFDVRKPLTIPRLKELVNKIK
ncbi:MAG: hypothetical protein DRJ59_05520 [Thermoprotei archaeon]|nr:MAG: hypothetical protein DRJ59_05520 [Thermoprotei archaeon]